VCRDSTGGIKRFVEYSLQAKASRIEMESKAGAARVSRHANPDPGKPASATPAHACDCHLHIVGPADRYPLIAERSYMPVEAGIGEYQRVASAAT
jgi:hypothetical protein